LIYLKIVVPKNIFENVFLILIDEKPTKLIGGIDGRSIARVMQLSAMKNRIR
jgi:hypothetical protein